MFVTTLFKRPSLIGIMVGMVLMALSLTPSLIPRSWTVQAAIAALSFLCGYGIGVGLNALWNYLQLPDIPERHQQRISRILLIGAALFLLYFVYRSLGWQNNVRATVGLEPANSIDPLRMLLLSVVLSALLLLVLRLLWWLAQQIVDLANRIIPRRLGQVIGVAIAALVIFLLINDVLIRTIFDVLNATYATANSQNYANVSPPTSPLRSGSPDSPVTWDSLGKEGRRFVGTGPTTDEIAEFWGGDAEAEPIRIYIGSESAATLEARAELALQELIRTGAFEREILVLVTSTGNGWVDANSLDAVEYIFGGDTAIVAFQYSYLPSVYSMLADKDAATEASVAMFDKIHAYWRTLDADGRPEFYLYALSLGTYGSQAAVTNVSQLNDPIHGALWAGPPFVSEFWQRITRHRDPASPIWLPVYQEGRTIRFTNTGEELDDLDGEWLPNRFIYLQQAGDPIVFFEIDSFYRVPEWLQEGTRSPKAPSEMKWYPVVTFWQLIFDMVTGTSDALPDGNGHRYSSDAYIKSWVAMTEPADWTEQQTEALIELFHSLGNLNKP
jgi:uncharacterized membrane protein